MVFQARPARISEGMRFEQFPPTHFELLWAGRVAEEKRVY
jgi:hypothetical protein